MPHWQRDAALLQMCLATNKFGRGEGLRRAGGQLDDEARVAGMTASVAPMVAFGYHRSIVISSHCHDHP